MTKKELTAFERQLKSRGYQKEENIVFDYKCRWVKIINPDEIPRARIMFDVYDWVGCNVDDFPRAKITATARIVTPGKGMNIKTTIEFTKSIEVEMVERTVLNYMETKAPCC